MLPPCCSKATKENMEGCLHEADTEKFYSDFEVLIQNIVRENNVKRCLIERKLMQASALEEDNQRKEKQILILQDQIETKKMYQQQLNQSMNLRQTSIDRLRNHMRLLDEHESSISRQIAIKKLEKKQRYEKLKSFVATLEEAESSISTQYQSGPLSQLVKNLKLSNDAATRPVIHESGDQNPTLEAEYNTNQTVTSHHDIDESYEKRSDTQCLRNDSQSDEAITCLNFEHKRTTPAIDCEVMYNAREDCLVVEDYEKSAMDGDDSAEQKDPVALDSSSPTGSFVEVELMAKEKETIEANEGSSLIGETEGRSRPESPDRVNLRGFSPQEPYSPPQFECSDDGGNASQKDNQAGVFSFFMESRFNQSATKAAGELFGWGDDEDHSADNDDEFLANLFSTNRSEKKTEKSLLF